MNAPAETSASSNIRVMLIDDQAMIGEAVRRMLLSESDIEYHYCNDPTLAVKAADDIKPTVILQDLVMPQIDGMTLAKEFRKNEATREVPLIVLSTKEDPKIKAEAFAIGANDYLVKLPDKVELIARIRHHSKGYINLIERIRAHKALEQSQKALAQELQEAADYVRSLLPDTLNGAIKSDWRFLTSSSLGGDAFGYHWIDDEHFSIYLIDVCGHGVGAALLSISVINVIRSESLPNVDFKQPSQVLGSLNEAFPMESNNNMYFTMWYGVFNKSTRTLNYGSGGHPPAVMVSNSSTTSPTTSQRLRTKGMLVGSMSGISFPSDQCQVPEGSSLYVFSDGTYEIEKPAGGMFELDEFVTLLETLQPENPTALGTLSTQITDIQGHDNFEDDFSIMKLDL
jgi:sigma-B regulation protein RsbU (phosphoserine phosphatase)